MNLTSLKSYLKPERPKSADYVRFLHLLLQGIGVHAVEIENDELIAFRSQLDKVAADITEESSMDAIVLGLGAALHALGEYNRQASRGLKAYSLELKSILTIMAETIAFLSSSSQTAVENLHTIDKNLARANDAGDLRILREKLVECLQLVREESVRQRTGAETRIGTLKTGVEQVSRTLHKAGLPALTTTSIDKTTGLPTRAAAEAAIVAKLANRADFMIALLMADRLPAINGRFGRTVGDEALMLVAQQLAQKIEELGQLMRWSGPGFITLIDMNNPIPWIERRIKEVAGARLEMNINTAERQTMVQLTCSWVLFKVTPSMPRNDIFQKLDNLLANHSGVSS